MEEPSIPKIDVGDHIKIPVHKVFHPETGHIGKVVHISPDRKTVTVKCEQKHAGKTVAFNIAYNATAE